MMAKRFAGSVDKRLQKNFALYDFQSYLLSLYPPVIKMAYIENRCTCCYVAENSSAFIEDRIFTGPS